MFPNRIKYHFTIFFNVVKLPTIQAKQRKWNYRKQQFKAPIFQTILLIALIKLLTFIISNAKLVSITVPGINLER